MESLSVHEEEENTRVRAQREENAEKKRARDGR